MSDKSSPPEGSSVDGEGTSEDHTCPSKPGSEENQQSMDGPEVREETLDEVHRQMSCVKGPVQKEHLRRAIKASSVDPEKLLVFLQVLVGQQGRVKVKSSSPSRFRSFVPSFSSRPRPVVKVFLHVTGTTCGAHQAILEKLEKLQSWSWTLEFTDDWRESDVFLVFCAVMTRPGADVNAAMRKLEGDKPVLLVVMYHTFNQDHSSDLRRWSTIYERVVFDVDVLFHETVPGLLKCPQNDDAIQQLEKKLKKYSKRR